jgi:hypothetical protein
MDCNRTLTHVKTTLAVTMVHLRPIKSGIVEEGMKPTTPPMVYIPKTIPVLAAAVSLAPIPKYF